MLINKYIEKTLNMFKSQFDKKRKKRAPFIATTKTTPFYLRKMQWKNDRLLLTIKRGIYKKRLLSNFLKLKKTYSKRNGIIFSSKIFFKKPFFLKSRNIRRKIYAYFFEYLQYRNRRKFNRSKYRKRRYQAVVNLKQTSNNYFITVLKGGKLVFWLSSGVSGFSGPKRSTPFAAEVTTRKVISKLKDLKVRHIKVILQSPFNYFIDSSLKIFSNSFLVRIKRLVTNIPKSHNGVRKSKKRSL